MNASTSNTSTRRKLIAVFSSNKEFQRDAESRLSSLAVYNVAVAPTDRFLQGPPPDAPPRLVILDVADGSLLDDARLNGARDAWGQTPIIVISDELAPERIRNMVRLQAVDWLQRPFDGKDLTATVVQNDSAGQATFSRVITFIGASGGVGSTSLALLAADYLAQKAGQPGDACLVDLDFQSASCGSYLNLVNEYDLESLIAHPERLDTELLELIKLEREPGLTLLSFEKPELPFAPTGRDFVLKLLDLVAYKHSEIVIDLPFLLTPWFDDVIRGSDHIFVVFEANIPSLRQTRRLLRRIRDVRGESESVQFIANKHHFRLIGDTISRRDIEKIFKGGRIRSIARDDALMVEAGNRGMLPGEISGRARPIKDALRIFEDVLHRKKSR